MMYNHFTKTNQAVLFKKPWKLPPYAGGVDCHCDFRISIFEFQALIKPDDRKWTDLFVHGRPAANPNYQPWLLKVY
jgi:hypothetical protein